MDAHTISSNKMVARVEEPIILTFLMELMILRTTLFRKL